MEAVRGKNDLALAAGDMGDGMMMCSDHPYRNNLGGICAFCLQEKLGKLVSSTSSSSPFPLPISTHNYPPSPPSSSPPSFTSSDVGPSANRTRYPVFASNPSGSRNPVTESGDSAARRTRIPFLLARKKKKKKLPAGPMIHGPPEAVLKRSKSSAGPRTGNGRHFLEMLGDDDEDYDSPRIRRGGGGGGFWSFLHLSASSSSSSKSGASRKGEKPSLSAGGGDSKSEALPAFEEESPGVVNGTGNQFQVFERKVSRSRSVGCGSRSFSGDIFERISTGFGDCTLRRVESHREGHNSNNRTPKQTSQPHHQQFQKMYKCGGIFGGFMMISAPSSASSYWVSSSTNADDHDHHHHHHHQVPGKSPALTNASNSRTRSWSWALASPMRAFAKPSKDGKREINIIRDGSGKNPAPDLSAIPSLLTVGG